ncbi:MAG: MerR family transcriptional regulator, partial [Lachnospiraceae bacterium]|nr:MerR family transcriptional regulator [Lachnospiraceae bacterium]
MKINEVEQQVGVSKKNIRFYELQGLLHPKRNSENGYREYDESDILCLKKIKLLRKLSLPIEEIRRIQSGDLL